MQDAHADHHGLLHIDDRQDYELDGIEVKNGKMVVEFRRSYDTCDDDDYMIDVSINKSSTQSKKKKMFLSILILFCKCLVISFQTGTTHIVFFSKEGPVRTIKGLDVSNVKIGMQRVQLIKSQLPDPEFPEDTFKFTMNVENVGSHLSGFFI